MNEFIEYINTKFPNITPIVHGLSKHGDAAHRGHHCLIVARNAWNLMWRFRKNNEWNEVFVGIAAALFHDHCDRKLITEEQKPEMEDEIKVRLREISSDDHVVDRIFQLTTNISFSKYSKNKNGHHIYQDPLFLYVQIADSMEQIGISGIYRAAAYMGQYNIPVVNKDDQLAISMRSFFPKYNRVGNWLLQITWKNGWYYFYFLFLYRLWIMNQFIEEDLIWVDSIVEEC
jgi:HD superfamily phosphodiesterase